MTATHTAPANVSFTIRGKVGQVVAYVYRTAKGQLAAIAYVGRSAKPAWHFLFRSLAEVARKVSGLVASVAASVAAKAAYRAEATAPNTLTVGQVVYTIGGYNMTTNHFFQVVRIIGKATVELQQIGSRVVSGDAGYQGSEVADASITIGAPFRARSNGDRASVNGKRAHLDDGRAHGFNKMD
jgi:hypothetical protein